MAATLGSISEGPQRVKDNRFPSTQIWKQQEVVIVDKLQKPSPISNFFHTEGFCLTGSALKLQCSSLAFIKAGYQDFPLFLSCSPAGMTSFYFVFQFISGFASPRLGFGLNNQTDYTESNVNGDTCQNQYH